MTKLKGGPGADSGGPVEVPEQLSILPLRNSVLFPGSIIPIDVGRRKSVRLVEEAISKERPVIGILTQRDAAPRIRPKAICTVGCAARILKVIKLAKDNFSVILQGVARIKVDEYIQQEPFITGRVSAVPDPTISDVELDALVMNLKDIAKRVIKLMPELPRRPRELVDSVTQPGQLADLITANLDIQVEEKQDVLETFDLKARMRTVLAVPLPPARGPQGPREDQHPGPGRDGPQPARVRTCASSSRRSRKSSASSARRGGSSTSSSEKITEAKMPAEVEKVAHQAAQAAQDHAAVVGRVHRRAHLPRVARRAAVVDRDRGQARHRRSARHPQRRPLRPREGEEAHPRVPGGAQAQERHEGSDPVPRWALPASARPRSASRSPGPSGASSCASRSAACATRRRSAATAAPTSARCRAA